MSNTTLDGIVMHEALHLGQHNQWDVIRDFQQAEATQP